MNGGDLIFCDTCDGAICRDVCLPNLERQHLKQKFTCPQCWIKTNGDYAPYKVHIFNYWYSKPNQIFFSLSKISIKLFHSSPISYFGPSSQLLISIILPLLFFDFHLSTQNHVSLLWPMDISYPIFQDLKDLLMAIWS